MRKMRLFGYFSEYQRLLPFAILLLALLVNSVSLPGDFFVDDVVIVAENPQVYSPNLKTILTSDYWGATESTGLYRPLTTLSFALNHALTGDGAWGYRTVNIILNGCVALLLFLLLQRLKVGTEVAWFSAALFAVHPVHGEAVLELVGRAELLVGLFVLLGLWFAQRREKWNELWVSLCFGGALLSKENGIVLLALLPAVDLFQRRRSVEHPENRWRLYLALTLIATAWLLFRHYGVQRPKVGKEFFDTIFVPLSGLEPIPRIMAALKVQVLYLSRMLLPVDLQGMYPPSTVIPPPEVVSLWGGIIIAVIGILLAVIWWGWRTGAITGLAMLLYVISFSPTSNLLILTEVTMAERLAYLPSVWFCSGFVAALFQVLQRCRVASRTILLTLCAVLSLYAVAGTLRSLDFRSPENLWRKDLKINAANQLSSLFLAEELWRQGRKEEAEKVYRELTRLAPKFSEAHRAYAHLLLELKRPEEAIPVAQRSIRYGRGIPPAYIVLADAYRQVGRYSQAFDALEKYRQTGEHRAFFWEVYGKTLAETGDQLGALEAYQRELGGGGPHSDDILQRIAKVQLQLGRGGAAEETIRRELLRKESGTSWNSLGVALAMQHKEDEAQQAFMRALELEPDRLEFRNNLERAKREKSK